MPPFSFIDYKGLQVGSVTPSEAGGIAIDGNMRAIADRVGPVAEVNGAPGVTDDDAGGGGNGTFFTWSKWRDTSNDDVYTCVDPATGAAVWKLLTAPVVSGGLNASAGALQTGANANVGGNVSGSATLSALGEATLVNGDVDGTAASAIRATVNVKGSILTGYVTTGGVVEIDEDVRGGICAGYATGTNSAVTLKGGGQGPGFLIGYCTGGGKINVTGIVAGGLIRTTFTNSLTTVSGSCAWVNAETGNGGTTSVQNTGSVFHGRNNGGAVTNAGNGSVIAGNCNNPGDILNIQEAGSLLVGTCIGLGNGATMRCGLSPNKAQGSRVFGVAFNTDGPPLIETLGDASEAWGFANNSRIAAIGRASFASANADNNGDCIATADGAHQISIGDNVVENSLQVGAVGTSIHLHADGLPAAPAGGDIWNVTGDVFVRTGGTSLNLSSLGGDKSITFPISMITGSNRGDHRVVSIGATGANRFNFAVPDDFGTLTSLELVGIPMAGAAGASKDIDLFSDYGAIGENFAAHSESDTTTLYDFTGDTDLFISIDLSVVFSSLAAGDFCGCQVDHNSIGGGIDYKLIKMVYTPA